MRAVVTVLLITASVALPSSLTARTWYIMPDGTGDAPTIQAGIDSSQSGDDVLLAPGTYTWTNQGASGESMIAMKSGVWLHSEAGPDVTVLDAEEQGRVIICWNVDHQATVEGFTIRDGRGMGDPTYYGGGVYCDSSSPTITGNVMTSNWGWWGAAVACINGSHATITENRLFGNTALHGSGGIYVHDYSSPTISYNVITDNSADNAGGIGVWYYSWPTITNNTIAYNSATFGGGIYCNDHANAVIARNIIANSTEGAATLCIGSTPMYICNDLWDNAGGDAVCGTDGGENFSADPMFCGAETYPEDPYRLDIASPCTVHNSSCRESIGARPEGCDGLLSTEPTTWGRVKAMYR